MNVDQFPILRRLVTPYVPDSTARQFIERAQSQSRGGIDVQVAVLDSKESHKFFGVPMGRRAVQPVWLRITNGGDVLLRLNRVGLDPNCFSTYEAAAVNHFSAGKRLLGYGALAWLFLPLLFLLPLKLITAWRANSRMDAYFQKHAFRLRPINPGTTQEGFVFTPMDVGSKVMHVNLLGPDRVIDFEFTIPVPGLDADYLQRESPNFYPKDQIIDCDVPQIRQRLIDAPQATSNSKGTRNGDPVNLVVVGEFATILSAFGARWDETETINLATCWKTFQAFLMGAEYRYSPVSSLYLFGRSQEFSLQRIRESINERLHLRLWATPYRFMNLPVWIGQVSRDIGVRFTWRTWNLTTHRIDPDVDEARDYVVEDLLHAQRLEIATYVDGVGACDASSPRENLTGDPYFTDGKRAAVVVSEKRTTPKFIKWA